MSVPQVIVTLTPEGALQLELPGAGGMRRRIEMRPGEEASTMLRILHAQLASRVQIGLDGAPTAHQVRHWEKHQIFPDPRCPFCVAEREYLPAGVATRRSREKAVVLSEHGGVVVRRVPAKRSGRKKGARNVGDSKKSAQEMGL